MAQTLLINQPAAKRSSRGKALWQTKERQTNGKGPMADQRAADQWERPYGRPKERQTSGKGPMADQKSGRPVGKALWQTKRAADQRESKALRQIKERQTGARTTNTRSRNGRKGRRPPPRGTIIKQEFPAVKIEGW